MRHGKNNVLNYSELKVDLEGIASNNKNPTHFLTHTGLIIVDEFKKSELKNHPNFQEICRFVILCYDKNGLIKYVDDVEERKAKAIEDIGIKDRDLKMQLMSGKDRDVLALVIGYLKFQNNMKFANLVSYENAFWENIEILNEKKENKDEDKAIKIIALKSKVREENESLQKAIEELRKEIYPLEEADELTMFNRAKSTYGTGNILEKYARMKSESLEDG